MGASGSKEMPPSDEYELKGSTLSDLEKEIGLEEDPIKKIKKKIELTKKYIEQYPDIEYFKKLLNEQEAEAKQLQQPQSKNETFSRFGGGKKKSKRTRTKLKVKRTMMSMRLKSSIKKK